VQNFIQIYQRVFLFVYECNCSPLVQLLLRFGISSRLVVYAAYLSLSCFDTIPACDRRTDERTNGRKDRRPAYSYNMRQSSDACYSYRLQPCPWTKCSAVYASLATVMCMSGAFIQSKNVKYFTVHTSSSHADMRRSISTKF